jgi:hypothetical protein
VDNLKAKIARAASTSGGFNIPFQTASAFPSLEITSVVGVATLVADHSARWLAFREYLTAGTNGVCLLNAPKPIS